MAFNNLLYPLIPFFIIFSATLVQIITIDRKCKSNINKKIFSTNCNAMLDPTKKLFQLN